MIRRLTIKLYISMYFESYRVVIIMYRFLFFLTQVSNNNKYLISRFCQHIYPGQQEFEAFNFSTAEGCFQFKLPLRPCLSRDLPIYIYNSRSTAIEPEQALYLWFKNKELISSLCWSTILFIQESHEDKE